jgi:hypothetical protein
MLLYYKYYILTMYVFVPLPNNVYRESPPVVHTRYMYVHTERNRTGVCECGEEPCIF